MDRVRALAIVVAGLSVLLSAPARASTLPNGAQRSTTDVGWWEQWVVRDRIKFLYAPRDFIAGGKAWVKVTDLTNGKLTIDFAHSDFPHLEAGLTRQHIAPDGQGFIVTIPETVKTGNYPYRVEFGCGRPSRSCPTGSFYVPVRNDSDPLLEVKTGPRGFHLPVVAESSEFKLELKARHYPIENVRLIGDRDHVAAGIRSFELGEPAAGGAADFVAKQTIDTIRRGQPFHGLVRVNRDSGMAQSWNYLVSDWRGSPPELTLTFTYRDEYDREWRSQSAPITFEYHLPPWAVVLYYAGLLALATLAGAVGRLAAGLTIGKWRTEARTWGYSMLLAAVLCMLGRLLHAKLEPVGLFQLDLTSLQGLVAVGVVTGFVPEIIRARLRTLVPGQEAPEPSSTVERDRATNGHVSATRKPSPGRPFVDDARLAG